MAIIERVTYSEAVRVPKLEPCWTTPRSFKVDSPFVDTKPPPLQVKRAIRASCNALEPFLLEAAKKGWFLVSSCGSGHLVLMLLSTANSTDRAQKCRSFLVKRRAGELDNHHVCSPLKRNMEIRQANTGTSSAYAFGSFFWNLWPLVLPGLLSVRKIYVKHKCLKTKF